MSTSDALPKKRRMADAWRLFGVVALLILAPLIHLGWQAHERMSAAHALAEASGQPDKWDELTQDASMIRGVLGPAFPGMPEINPTPAQTAWAGCLRKVFQAVEWLDYQDWMTINLPSTDSLEQALRGETVGAIVPLGKDSDCESVARALKRMPRLKVVQLVFHQPPPPPEQILEIRKTIVDLKDCEGVFIQWTSFPQDAAHIEAWSATPHIRAVALLRSTGDGALKRIAAISTVRELIIKPTLDPEVTLAVIREVREAELKMYKIRNHGALINLGPLKIREAADSAANSPNGSN